jgi:hypothetical protein
MWLHLAFVLVAEETRTRRMCVAATSPEVIAAKGLRAPRDSPLWGRWQVTALAAPAWMRANLSGSRCAWLHSAPALRHLHCVSSAAGSAALPSARSSSVLSVSSAADPRRRRAFDSPLRASPLELTLLKCRLSIDKTYIRKPTWPLSNDIKSSTIGTSTMPVICADCCSGCSAIYQRHILYGDANQAGVLIEERDLVVVG